ncbi:MAG: hypothetical protein L6Q77_00650 [Bacteroidetes bacterium]|nr:hypothetical protein [Bacteroidota bacterium]
MIYRQTEDGKKEARNPSSGLPHLSRMILFLVDGKQDSAAIDLTLKNPPGLESAFQFLVDHHLIESAGEVTSATNGTDLRVQLISLFKTHLPAFASRAEAKLLSVPDDPDSLRSAFEGCCKVVRLTIDEKTSSKILQEGQSLLTHRG